MRKTQILALAALLAAVRSADLAALKKAVQEVDSSCSARHDDFRVKRRG